MRFNALVIIGILLIVAGAVAIAVEYIPVREKDVLVDVGPVRVESEKTRRLPLTVAGAVAAVAGIVLVAVGATRRSGGLSA